jgi:hypothetical protein
VIEGFESLFSSWIGVQNVLDAIKRPREKRAILINGFLVETSIGFIVLSHDFAVLLKLLVGSTDVYSYKKIRLYSHTLIFQYGI